MSTPHVFGYGSLVNTATHDYANPRVATVHGWRREWRHAENRTVAFLSVVPDATSRIDGLIAAVPPADWDALDQRERSYDRVHLSESHTPHARDITLHIYRSKPLRSLPPSTHHPILLSYLDVVVQGYAAQFGQEGVERFFATTDGWDAPILDDRAAPRYARHQPTTSRERGLVDDMLRALSAQVQQPE